MNQLRAAAVLAVLVSTAAAASAATIRVPDDAATIRSALDNALDGDTVIVSAGTYAEFLFLDQRNGLTLRAEGAVTLAPRSSVKGAPAVISLSSCQNVTVEGFTISKAPGHGISVGTCAGVSVLNCKVDGAKGAGVTVYGGTDVTIADCTVARSGKGHPGIGVSFEASPVSVRPRILRCTVTKSGGPGIGLRCDAGLVENCVVASPKGSGVEVHRLGGTQNTTLRWCTITKAGASGIVLSGRFLRAEDCEVTEPKLYGVAIVLDDAVATMGASVERVTVTRTKKKDGILVAAPECSVASCEVVSARGDGIRVEDSANVIDSNTVTGARRYGVHLLGSSHQVSGNVATGKKADLLDESTGSTLVGNTFETVK